MVKQLIGSIEIAERLGISEGLLSHKKNAVDSTMPRELYKKNKKCFYEREPMLVWIATQNPGKKHSVFDNDLAAAVLRRSFF